jgi:hypothetical protein
LVEKHGANRRRSWRKLHIGVDADTGQIVAAALTTHDLDDGSQVAPLLDQIDNPIASFTDKRQATEVAIAVAILNRMLELGRPSYARIA